MSGSHNRRQARPDPIPQRSLETSFGRCLACGKLAYTSKANAKQAAKVIHPGVKMRAYRCADGQWWHLTSQDAAHTARMRTQRAGGQ